MSVNNIRIVCFSLRIRGELDEPPRHGSENRASSGESILDYWKYVLIVPGEQNMEH